LGKGALRPNAVSLRKTKVTFSEKSPEIRVTYKGVEVGFYKADLWVSDCIIVELKVERSYVFDDEPQLLNELKATGVKVGLLINFGRSKVEFKRMVF
jgi:GxxExxY protein